MSSRDGTAGQRAASEGGHPIEAVVSDAFIPLGRVAPLIVPAGCKAGPVVSVRGPVDGRRTLLPRVGADLPEAGVSTVITACAPIVASYPRHRQSDLHHLGEARVGVLGHSGLDAGEILDDAADAAGGISQAAAGAVLITHHTGRGGIGEADQAIVFGDSGTGAIGETIGHLGRRAAGFGGAVSLLGNDHVAPCIVSPFHLVEQVARGGRVIAADCCTAADPVVSAFDAAHRGIHSAGDRGDGIGEWPAGRIEAEGPHHSALVGDGKGPAQRIVADLYLVGSSAVGVSRIRGNDRSNQRFSGRRFTQVTCRLIDDGRSSGVVGRNYRDQTARRDREIRTPIGGRLGGRDHSVDPVVDTGDTLAGQIEDRFADMAEIVGERIGTAGRIVADQ